MGVFYLWRQRPIKVMASGIYPESQEKEVYHYKKLFFVQADIW